MKVPTAFVSYSWNSVEGAGHEEWVLLLAKQLSLNGIDVRLDKWITKAGISLTQFMEEEVTKSDFVIAVCTPAFAERSNQRKGAAGYEQQIVSGQILAGAPREKFIPIIRKGSTVVGPDYALPSHFLGTIYLDFRNDDLFESSLEELVRALFDARKHARPELSSPPAYVRDSLAAANLQRPVKMTVEVDNDMQLTGGMHSANQLIEAARTYVLSNRKVSFTISCEEFQSELERFDALKKSLFVGTISPDELTEYLTLKKTLLQVRLLEDWGDKLFSRTVDLAIAIETIVSIPEIFKRYFSPQDLAIVWYSYCEQESISYAEPTGARFDLYPQSQAHSCVLHLTPEETKSLQDSEDMDIRFMTGQWGLTLDLLPKSCILPRAIPAMIREFVRHGRWSSKEVDAESFFEKYPWRVGLH